jgi:hypothetical protein
MCIKQGIFCGVVGTMCIKQGIFRGVVGVCPIYFFSP